MLLNKYSLKFHMRFKNHFPSNAVNKFRVYFTFCAFFYNRAKLSLLSYSESRNCRRSSLRANSEL